MGWYDSYKPQTSGVDVAKGMRESGNAFTALGKAFGDIGENIIKKKKREEESAYNQLRKDSMEFAFQTAKEQKAQKSVDEQYLKQVHARPNKKSFEKNYDGSLKPSLDATMKAKQYWDDQDKKLELAGAWVDKQVDDEYKGLWGAYQVANPNGTYADFAKKNAYWANLATPETKANLMGAWDKQQLDNKKFDLDVRKADANIAQSQASIANSGANKKYHEYQLESAKNKDTENKNTDMFDREYFLAKDKKKFIEDRLSKGEYVPSKYLTKKDEKPFQYSASTGKNIVALVKTSLGMNNPLVSVGENTQKKFGDMVTQIDSIARKHNLPANQAYTIYLSTKQEQNKNSNHNNTLGATEDKKNEVQLSPQEIEQIKQKEIEKIKSQVAKKTKLQQKIEEVNKEIERPSLGKNKVHDPRTGKDIIDILNIVP